MTCLIESNTSFFVVEKLDILGDARGYSQSIGVNSLSHVLTFVCTIAIGAKETSAGLTNLNKSVLSVQPQFANTAADQSQCDAQLWEV